MFLNTWHLTFMLESVKPLKHEVELITIYKALVLTSQKMQHIFMIKPCP